MSTEAILQQTFVHMFRTLYPDLILNLSLNGISLNGLSALNKAQVIAQAKREGMETGIQDLTIYLPEGKVLNLEFKRPNGGVQSEEQKKVEAKLLALGHNYHLVRSVEQVFDLISLNTTLEFRTSQYKNLFLPNDGKIIVRPFFGFPTGTPLSQVQHKLKVLYHIF